MKAQCLSSDIITTLPQAIIEAILCLLPIEEAARTSILSKEWRYKWTRVPKLVFRWFTMYRKKTEETPLSDSEQTYDIASARKNMDLRCKLLYAIQQVLLLRQAPIVEFNLSMEVDDTGFELDQIILHMSRNHTLKKLTLALSEYSPGQPYVLPICVFSLHHLTDLYLEYCVIKHKPIFNGFVRLTSLSLRWVKMSKESLLHLLSSCPSLKRLCLFLYEDDFLSDEKPSIMELFKCLPVIEHLKTWGYGMWLKSLFQASTPEELPTSLIHLKYVCIKYLCFLDSHGLPFLAVLSKCCLNLEKIKLEINMDHEHETEFVMLGKKSDVCLEHLNELEIKDFIYFKREMEFVKLILARSPNLKKVILVTSTVDREEELEMLKILLNAPRASSVEFVVNNRSNGYMVARRILMPVGSLNFLEN